LSMCSKQIQDRAARSTAASVYRQQAPSHAGAQANAESACKLASGTCTPSSSGSAAVRNATSPAARRCQSGTPPAMSARARVLTARARSAYDERAVDCPHLGGGGREGKAAQVLLEAGSDCLDRLACEALRRLAVQCRGHHADQRLVPRTAPRSVSAARQGHRRLGAAQPGGAQEPEAPSLAPSRTRTRPPRPVRSTAPLTAPDNGSLRGPA
jgi:hypothetical protein